MKSMPIKEAQGKICFLTMLIASPKLCKGDGCISWKKTHDEIQRENHSGGMEMMMETRSKRNFQELKRSGPRNSCQEILYFEEMGRCCLLPKD